MILDEFLVSIGFHEDKKSRKDVEDAVASVSSKIQVAGLAIGAAAVGIAVAIKQISSSLAELYYAGRETGATAHQIQSIGRAGKAAGGEADQAAQSFQAFAAAVRTNPEGMKAYFKNVTGENLDPNNLVKSWMKAREVLAREYRQHSEIAGPKAEALGLGNPAAWASAEYQEKFNQVIANEEKGAAGFQLLTEKAVKLDNAFRGVFNAIETIRQEVAGDFFDDFGASLKSIETWLKEHKQEILEFFHTLTTQILLAKDDLVNLLGPVLGGLWDAFKTFTGWLEKMLGLDDSQGVRGLRVAFEGLGILITASWGLRIAAALLTAFNPITLLIASLVTLAQLWQAVKNVREHPEERKDWSKTGNWFWDTFVGDGSGYGRASSGALSEGRSIGPGGGVGRAGARGGSATPAAMKTAMAAAMDQYIKEGGNPANARAAAAIMVGEAMSESGLNPNASHDHGTGHGIYGARNDRWTKMDQWINNQPGGDKNSLAWQQRYMMHEGLSGAYPSTRAALMGASQGNMLGATYGVTKNFEAPAVVNDRTGAVERAYRSLDLPMKSPDLTKTPAPGAGKTSQLHQIDDKRQANITTEIKVSGSSPVDQGDQAMTGRKPAANAIHNMVAFAQ